MTLLGDYWWNMWFAVKNLEGTQTQKAVDAINLRFTTRNFVLVFVPDSQKKYLSFFTAKNVQKITFKMRSLLTVFWRAFNTLSIGNTLESRFSEVFGQQLNLH